MGVLIHSLLFPVGVGYHQCKDKGKGAEGGLVHSHEQQLHTAPCKPRQKLLPGLQRKLHNDHGKGAQNQKWNGQQKPLAHRKYINILIEKLTDSLHVSPPLRSH